MVYFEMDYFTRSRGMLSYFHRFSGFMWTGENDSNTLRVDAYFLGGRKNLSFQNIRIHVDRAFIY